MDDERLGVRRWMMKVREVRAMTTTTKCVIALVLSSEGN